MFCFHLVCSLYVINYGPVVTDVLYVTDARNVILSQNPSCRGLNYIQLSKECITKQI